LGRETRKIHSHAHCCLPMMTRLRYESTQHSCIACSMSFRCCCLVFRVACVVCVHFLCVMIFFDLLSVAAAATHHCALITPTHPQHAHTDHYHVYHCAI